MQKQGIRHGTLFFFGGGGAAVACAKVGQVKIKTHDVAGGLGEAGFNRGGGGGSGKNCAIVGRFLGFNYWLGVSRKSSALTGGF